MAVDVVVQKRSSQLLGLAVATLLIWVLESVFEYLYSILWRNLAQNVQHRLRLDAYRHVQKLPLLASQQRSTGSLLNLLQDDINQLERFLDGGANSLIQVLTTVILVGATFFYLSPTVAALAFLPIPVILGGAFTFQRRLQPLYGAVREQAAGLNARLNLNLHGLFSIQSAGAEDFEAARVEQESQRYLHSNSRAIALSSAFTPVLRMAILLGFMCTLVVGGQQCLSGQLSPGSYSVLVFLTQRLLWPLTGLAATADLFERAMASVHRILDLLELPVVDLHRGHQLRRDQVRGNLCLEDVHFSYPGRGPTLQGVSLHLPAGQTTAVVGPTGSGKSTLVRLLLGFLQPDQGRIILDGQSLSEISPSSLRECFALVSQEVYLHDDTVMANVAYADPNPRPEAVESALRQAEAWDFVQSLPEGPLCSLGERAQQLSGGQKQRLAIARALYRQAPILILDEATSAVDNETEAALSRSLEKLCQGRTTLVIAHRLSTIRQAHCIHVLDQGRLVESGTHEQLLQQGGLYAALWAIQSS